MDVDGGVNSEKIVILDAGAQYSKLIDRLVIGEPFTVKVYELDLPLL